MLEWPNHWQWPWVNKIHKFKVEDTFSLPYQWFPFSMPGLLSLGSLWWWFQGHFSALLPLATGPRLPHLATNQCSLRVYLLCKKFKKVHDYNSIQWSIDCCFSLCLLFNSHKKLITFVFHNSWAINTKTLSFTFTTCSKPLRLTFYWISFRILFCDLDKINLIL